MVIDKKYVEDHRQEFINSMKDGSVFIYPTDTIYGLGCNALLGNSVTKIRLLKQREIKPLSIIAPGQNWIRKMCRIDYAAEEHLSNLPGPYTLILNLQYHKAVHEEVNPLENGTLGVRIPDHWFTKLIQEAEIPFITTSVNISGAPYMTSLETLDETIKNNVDFIIYEGENRGKESIKIDLTRLV